MYVGWPDRCPTALVRTATLAPSYRPATDVPAVLTETIDEACTKPAESWCKYLKKAKERRYKIDARPGAITVQTKIPDSAKGKKLAAKLCAYLGAFHFDEDATRLDATTSTSTGATPNRPTATPRTTRDGSPESEFALSLALALASRGGVGRVHGWTGPRSEAVRLVRW